jgi:hypothetical protein
MKLFVLNSNKFIEALSFQIALKVKKKTFLSKLNVKTSSRRLKPDSCQTHQHKTDRLTPDSRQTQTPPDSTIGSTIALICIYCYRSRHGLNLISFFFASHERLTRTMKRDGHWLLGVEDSKHVVPVLIILLRNISKVQ